MSYRQGEKGTPDDVCVVEPEALTPPAPGEDGGPRPCAWIESWWFLAPALVITLGLVWARAQGWV